MIRLNNIVVKFGDFTALHDINVHVKEGEFFTFLGPSGCGKTTTLRTITGFIEPAEGQVFVRDRDITHVPIEDRNIGIVFQSYALFPTMTVYDNIAFGLRVKKMKKAEVDEKVRAIAKKVDLSDEQLKKAEANVLGTVLNFCEDKKSEYYYEYYSKDGKKLSKIGVDADAPQLNTAPAQQAPRPRTAPAVPKSQPTTAPGLKPIPQGQPVASPDSTSQFLAQTGYSPRTYTEE